MAVLVLLLTANAILFALWPVRRHVVCGADQADWPLHVNVAGQEVLSTAGVLRNVSYLRWFFDAIRRDHHVLFFGTSESTAPHNIGAQLNHLRPHDPGLVILARGGLSPIHGCLVFARCRQAGIAIPPVILIVNPIYFTSSHDSVNESWLSNVTRTFVFLMMNHGDIHAQLPSNVRRIYNSTFAEKRFLWPFWMQEYLGNLLYLNFHQADVAQLNVCTPPIPVYVFDGKIPEYDRIRAVPPGYVPPDQLAKGRWAVNDADQSDNLAGLDCSLEMLKREQVPVLVIVLPTNRLFYAANGLDMNEYSRKYHLIRDRIATAATGDHVFLLDLFDLKLDMGFEDRMHADAYGNSQIANLVDQSPQYNRFIEAVRRYYADHP